MNPLLYTLGNFITDIPWYIMATVPFRGHERFKLSRVLALLSFMALLPATVGGLIMAFMPENRIWEEYHFVLHMSLLPVAYYACFKVHITKLIYVILQAIMLAASIASMSNLVVSAWLPDRGITLIGEPAWIFTAMLLSAVVVPLMYRYFKGALRQALFELNPKSVLSLCIVPVAFYVGLFAYFLTIGAFSTPLIEFFIVSLGLLLSYTQMLLMQNTRKSLAAISAMQIAELKNDFLQQNHQTLETHFTQIARMKHEMRHHLFAVSTLFKDGSYEQLGKYLSALQTEFAEIKEPVVCANRVIQAVLNQAAHRAREMGFEIKFDIHPLPELSVTDTELVSLFSNILNNALESCAKVPEGRFIRLSITRREPYLSVTCTNSRGGTIHSENGVLKSTKAESGHGYGLWVIKRIAEAHGGFIDTEYDESSFTLTVVLRP